MCLLSCASQKTQIIHTYGPIFKPYTTYFIKKYRDNSTVFWHYFHFFKNTKDDSWIRIVENSRYYLCPISDTSRLNHYQLCLNFRNISFLQHYNLVYLTFVIASYEWFSKKKYTAVYVCMYCTYVQLNLRFMAKTLVFLILVQNTPV